MGQVHISIVSPVYQAENLVSLLVSEIKKNVEPITTQYEILLVEDGSSDNSWQEIQKETEKDKRVKGIKLSRNFGQHYSISAGLKFTKGDWIIVMDCDLQDKPSEIIKLYQKANEGFDIVLGKRTYRKDDFSKKFFSKLFYKILTYLTGVKQDATTANFGIYKKNVIEVLNSMKEQVRYFPTMINWVGFSKTAVFIEHGSRQLGKSTYNYRKLFRLALDIIVANSDKPIKLLIKIGFFTSLVSFILGIVTLIRYFIGDILVIGYASLMVSIWFLAGLILMVLGVIGLYIGKTFEQVKDRPFYIIEKKVNIEN